MRATTAHCVALIGMLLVLAGCQKSPFAADLPRTPYERYQLLRGDAPPAYELDTFGRRRPALRARLTPNERR
ncbi:MAG: hypothetical protein ACIAXF_08415 [Phycisphaerales bacterium JB063]